ncbi:alpha/beta hydrolase family protein [Thalassotalea mangrovi]|uniref:Alpha/beta hydrolase n=1 Tax=Thalassotalea mangrovi TaxID=2572245 RepID=A0A4U1B7Z0_9GAMM|nr:hypothetical protein [Thalassotalea mangrovi]TKB46043.1 hypothetical protein E8M12_05290 [Thalassotalea mangrovi]
MSKYKLTIVLFSVLMVLACSEPPVLPEAKPLQASAEQLAQIPFRSAGELQIKINRDIELYNQDLNRPLSLTAMYPAQGEDYPLVIFSPGNFSNKDYYDAVLAHWVSHGYVVLAPQHEDCCGMVNGIFNSLWYGEFGLVEQRILDINFLLSQLSNLAQQIPELHNKFDEDNIAMAGHSFGGFTAQQFAGAGTYNPDDGQYHYYQNPDIKAVVALSPPGPMFDVITKDSWHSVKGPMLITTGTWDVDGRFFKTWDVHKMSFDTASDANQYALVIEGADHYLGNLICRPEREHAPQTDALTMVNAATTAFLHRYLKADEDTATLLEADTLTTLTQGFAYIESR